jgi:DNA mismatch endonuclease, patch repair protein
MTDVVSPQIRSRMMAGIRGFNTKPELFLRSGLHARGLRFRIHDRRLPGRPDLVFKKRNAALFAHGCFWHGHDCSLFKWPRTRPEWWAEKITRNRTNDAQAEARLASAGWRVGVVWECSLRGPGRLPAGQVLGKCEKWLKSKKPRLEIRGVK